MERFQVTFQKECGTDDICQSYLVVKGKVVENLDLSEHEPFWVNITVNNERESAYEANLYIIHPLALSYVNVDQHTVSLQGNYGRFFVVDTFDLSFSGTLCGFLSTSDAI